MINFNKIYDSGNEYTNLSLPIVMVSASDLEEVVRGILEDVISASKDEKDETLLSVKQASALLGVNRSTLWAWEKNGYLKPIRVGRKVRYPAYLINELRKGGGHGE